MPIRWIGVVMAVWIVKGKFERHQRKFEVQATSLAEAEYQAEVYIFSVLSKGQGAYSRLVWQQGEISMKNVETGEVARIFACPPSLEGM